MAHQGAIKCPDQTKSVRDTYQATLTVSEKIIQVQHDHDLHQQGEGPTMELFYHELRAEKTVGRQIFNAVFTFFAGLAFILLYPFIAVAVKVSSSGPVLVKIKSDGLAGRLFDRLAFRTRPVGTHTTKGSQYTQVGQILKSTKLCKLPSVINILRGDMNAMGPAVFSHKKSTHWNNVFRDFYKRCAIKPGLMAVSTIGKDNKTKKDVSAQLEKEFKYIAHPRFKDDLNAMTGNF